MAGLATGAFIGMLLQLWVVTVGDHGLGVPTVGEALLAGLGLGSVAAALVSLLGALHARLDFWGLFLPVLLVALITGIIGCSATIWMVLRVNQDGALTARRRDDGCW